MLAYIALLLLPFQAVDVDEGPTPPPVRSGPPSREWMEQFMKDFERNRPPSAGDVLYRELAKFRGKPARYAFDRIGYPDRKMVIEGDTVYSWAYATTNRDGSPLHCTVKVIVRRSVIAKTDFAGNEGACSHFASRLDPKYVPL